MKPIFIIPARGGSKGIPGKNIKLLGGKPLIAYAVDVAREAAGGDDSRVILSTDEEAIANAVQRMGLRVEYMRPQKLAEDTTPMHPVILHAMNWADTQGLDYDTVVLLQPTSPLRTAADVKAALDTLEANPGADMAVTVTEAAGNPYYNLYEPTAPGGALAVSKGNGKLARRQDAPKVYQYNGAVYAMRAASLRLHPMHEMPVKLPVVMPAERSLDLDTPLDWLIVETIINNNAVN